MSDPTRVAFFATCLADRFFADACLDAVRVLRHFGVSVEVPAGQTCCGQPAYNTGRREEAVRMARHTDSVLAGAKHVVVPSGSCAGMVRSCYPELLRPAGTQPLAGAARERAERSRELPERTRELRERTRELREPGGELPERTYELAEYLVRVLGVLDGGAGAARQGEALAVAARDADESPGLLGAGLAGRRVAYHHGCHALRQLGVREEPVQLLRACGAEVVPWDGDTECCGFGGLFSVKFPEVSAGMADRKLDALSPEVDLVTSADGGCLLQLSGRWTHRGDGSGPAEPRPAFVHLATLLREGLGL